MQAKEIEASKLFQNSKVLKLLQFLTSENYATVPQRWVFFGGFIFSWNGVIVKSTRIRWEFRDKFFVTYS